MTRPYFRILVPLIVITALLLWWFIPHYSDEDKAYYVAVFCTINRDTADDPLVRMEQVIEGGNSDYALSKTHFSSALAKTVITGWARLGAQDKQYIQLKPDSCTQRLLSEINR